MSKFKLGLPAKDIITGFEGVIVAKAEYLTGCDQYLLQPGLTDPNKYSEASWFDENRLELLATSSVFEKGLKSEEVGCDYTAPIK